MPRTGEGQLHYHRKPSPVNPPHNPTKSDQIRHQLTNSDPYLNTPLFSSELSTPTRVQRHMRKLLTAAILAAAVSALPIHAQLAEKPDQPKPAEKAQAD